MDTHRNTVTDIFVTKVLLIGADLQPEHYLLSADGSHIDTLLTAYKDMDSIIDLVRQTTPHVVIISEQGSPDTADELCFSITHACKDVKVLIVAEDTPDLIRLRASGFKCRGFIPDSQRSDIVRIVNAVQSGEAWLPRMLVAELLDMVSMENDSAVPFLRLVK